MALELSSSIAAVAYAGFVVSIALLTRRRPAVPETCRDRFRFTFATGLSIGFALASFLFLPAGVLPPIICVQGGLTAVPLLCMASLAAFHAARSDGALVNGVMRHAVTRAIFPTCLLAAVFSWVAYTRGMPGGLGDISAFGNLPLWSIMDEGGRVGLALAGVGFLLLSSAALSENGFPPLLRDLFRFVQAQFFLALLFPATLSRLFFADMPPQALVVDFIANWAAVLFLARLVFPMAWRRGPVRAKPAADAAAHGRLFHILPATGWSLLTTGLILCVADTLELFR